MFEVGRAYEIVMQDPETTWTMTRDVLEWSPPLLKIKTGGNYQIINVGSIGFVSARPDDEESRLADAKEHQDFLDSIAGEAKAKQDAANQAKIDDGKKRTNKGVA